MRKLHQLYAFLLGYFWLPCPRCGRMFGGHEIGTTATLQLNGRAQRVNCRRHDWEIL